MELVVRGRGFTLIELLITVAILSIVTTFAVGGYRQYIRRANRVDATSALLHIASAQEKFYAQNGQYAGNADLATAPPAGLGIPSTERRLYSLAVALDAGGPTLGFTATATVDPSAAQHDDDDCWVFSVDSRGLRSAETRSGGSGTAVTERCWR